MNAIADEEAEIDAKIEHTIGILLNLSRRISDNVFTLAEAKWDKDEFGKSTGVKSRVLGILG